MESSKQKFVKEAKIQMRRLTDIENVITREGNNRHIYEFLFT